MHKNETEYMPGVVKSFILERDVQGIVCILVIARHQRLTFRKMSSYRILMFLFICHIFLTLTTSKDSWKQPGCHKIGHTRKISIPGCVEFHMTTNACRGFCESWAVPSGPKTSSNQPVTSVGQCCNIMDTELVEARVYCVDGARTLTFKSAVSCACYHCKKD